MKRLLALLVALTCYSAHAQIAGFIISAAQLVVDRSPVYYAKVQATGPDAERARQHAFRLAVEQAVGVVVLNETEVKNGSVVRNEIIHHSSGYVDKFNILEQKQVGNSVQLTVEVWVASSMISNRLLNSSSTAGVVNGSRIAVQISSLQDQRQQTDKLLDAFFRDYPTRAFDIILQPVKVWFAQNRQGYLTVPFAVRWNSQYINSLTELVKTVDQFPNCKIKSGQCNGAVSSIVVKSNAFASDPGAWFKDDISADIIYKHMFADLPVYQLTLETTQGKDYVYCFNASHMNNYVQKPDSLVGTYGSRININATEVGRSHLTIDLSDINARDVTGANVNIVRKSNCKSTF